jgi:lipooligosaccharide transport system ATP-binding protein
MDSNTAITVKGLSKTFGDTKAVDNLDFHVKEAECFGLLGPNGAGKTTTMKILYGKSEHDENRSTVIDVFGFSPKKSSLAIKAFSGIVPQQDNLDTELNVTENLLIYSKFYGIASKEAKIRIDELLSFMELKDKVKSKINELSGGMQRRLTIARALINRPRLLILDEPTTGLDPQVRHLIWNKLRELRDTGVTILLTTHYMEEAYQICDRIIIMDKGKKMLEGNPKKLLSDNLEKFVIEVYGSRRDSGDFTSYFIKNGIRYEYFNDTLFAYCNDHEVLSGFGDVFRGFDYNLRHTNLEDVFLNVTGRSLNEYQ